MFNINEGLFGLYNFEDTVLEVTPEDSFIKGCARNYQRNGCSRNSSYYCS